MSVFFPEQRVVILKTSDFRLDTEEKILINDRNLCMVLFADHSKTSEKLAKFWTELSETVAGVKYCICDLINEPIVGQAMSSVAIDLTSPYVAFASNTTPFILVYRQGRPQKCYYGVLDLVNLKNFSMLNASNLRTIEEKVVVEPQVEEKVEDIPTIA